MGNAQDKTAPKQSDITIKVQTETGSTDDSLNNNNNNNNNIETDDKNTVSNTENNHKKKNLRSKSIHRRKSKKIDDKEEEKKERTLEDVYEIENKIGEGSFGVVFKGKKKDTNEAVAIKVINRNKFAENPSLNFEREASVMASINHPNVVRFYDFFKTPDRLVLVMEYVPGGELFDILAEKGSFGESEVIGIMKQVLSALAYLHSKGIAHRDLKPDNFLCANSDDGHLVVKIADFGLSKNISAGEQLKTLAGTPYYIAPEILLMDEDQAYTVAVDMWAVGVIAYVLLSGSHPFISEDSSNSNELFQRIMVNDYSFSEKFDDISKNAKDFISKCLVLEPNERMTAEQALKHPWIVGNEPIKYRKALPSASMASFKKYVKEKKK